MSALFSPHAHAAVDPIDKSQQLLKQHLVTQLIAAQHMQQLTTTRGLRGAQDTSTGVSPSSTAASSKRNSDVSTTSDAPALTLTTPLVDDVDDAPAVGSTALRLVDADGHAFQCRVNMRLALGDAITVIVNGTGRMSTSRVEAPELARRHSSVDTSPSSSNSTLNTTIGLALAMNEQRQRLAAIQQQQQQSTQLFATKLLAQGQLGAAANETSVAPSLNPNLLYPPYTEATVSDRRACHVVCRACRTWASAPCSSTARRRDSRNSTRNGGRRPPPSWSMYVRLNRVERVCRRPRACRQRPRSCRPTRAASCRRTRHTRSPWAARARTPTGTRPPPTTTPNVSEWRSGTASDIGYDDPCSIRLAATVTQASAFSVNSQPSANSPASSRPSPKHKQAIGHSPF